MEKAKENKGASPFYKYFVNNLRKYRDKGEVVVVKDKVRSSMKNTYKAFGPTYYISKINDNVPRTIDRLSVLCQESYYMYRKGRKTRIGSRSELSTILRAIFSSAGELAATSDGGLYLEEFGYFVPTVNIMESEKLKDVIADWKIGDLFYLMTFYPDVSSKSILRDFSMDRSFSTETTGALYEKIVEGHRPKNWYSMLKYVHNPKNIK